MTRGEAKYEMSAAHFLPKLERKTGGYEMIVLTAEEK